MKRVFRAAPALFLLMATVTAASADQMAARTGPGSRTVISHEQLVASQRTDVLDYVRLYQPQWLRTRGATPSGVTTVMVYVDGNRLGGPSELRGLPTAIVSELRYLDGREATTLWGAGHERGAILVRTGPVLESSTRGIAEGTTEE